MEVDRAWAGGAELVARDGRLEGDVTRPSRCAGRRLRGLQHGHARPGAVGRPDRDRPPARRARPRRGHLARSPAGATHRALPVRSPTQAHDDAGPLGRRPGAARQGCTRRPPRAMQRNSRRGRPRACARRRRARIPCRAGGGLRGARPARAGRGQTHLGRLGAGRPGRRGARPLPARVRGDARSAQSHRRRCRRALPRGRHPDPGRERRPRAHRRCDRQASRHRRRRSSRHHRLPARRDARRRARPAARDVRGDRVRTDLAGGEAAHRGRAEGLRPRRRDDGRRRQRRPGAAAGRHRRRDGRERDGRGAGGRDDDPHRRRLHEHRDGGRGGAPRLRQHPQVHPLHLRARSGRGPAVPPLRALRRRHPAAAHGDADPGDRPRNGDAAGDRARTRARGAGHDDPAAARTR